MGAVINSFRQPHNVGNGITLHAPAEEFHSRTRSQEGLYIHINLNGKRVGDIGLYEGKSHISLSPRLNESVRGKGIGVAIYRYMDALARRHGTQLRASKNLTPAGYALWNKFSPESVKHYVRTGSMGPKGENTIATYYRPPEEVPENERLPPAPPKKKTLTQKVKKSLRTFMKEARIK